MLVIQISQPHEMLANIDYLKSNLKNKQDMVDNKHTSILYKGTEISSQQGICKLFCELNDRVSTTGRTAFLFATTSRSALRIARSEI